MSILRITFRALQMREDQRQFLSVLGRVPARLTAEQTAWVLNCQPHDVPVLVAAGLLKPLGNPPQNGTKFFAASEVIERSDDLKWLGRVTAAIHGHWRMQNARKNHATRNGALNGDPVVLGAAESSGLSPMPER